jgi:NTP pyrophosphatase (non-canonical NTP hydrolase)
MNNHLNQGESRSNQEQHLLLAIKNVLDENEATGNGANTDVLAHAIYRRISEHLPIYEDVYDQLVERLEPHVIRDPLKTSNTFPASVVDSFNMLMDYWESALCPEIFHDKPVDEAALPFQARTRVWLNACFGELISSNKEERNHRFLEESIELVQANGTTKAEATMLVDYVYSRPIGELEQEIGGVMLTLAALCQANGVSMLECGETELARVWTKVEQIRAKQAAKPASSPLPMVCSPNE